MKRFVFAILCLIHLVSPLKATRSELDSLYLFCEQIGEDSANISKIMNSPDAAIPSFIIDNYLSLLRLQ